MPGAPQGPWQEKQFTTETMTLLTQLTLRAPPPPTLLQSEATGLFQLFSSEAQ